MKHAARAALLCGLFAIVGCGNDAESLCEDICDCEGCSESEFDECVDTVDDLERTADNEGCSDQYDEALSCVAEEVECRDDDVDIDGCDGELERLSKCIDDNDQVFNGPREPQPAPDPAPGG
jgi:hypothetical protein